MQIALTGRSLRGRARALATCALLVFSSAGHAQSKEGATPLDSYLQDLKTLRVEFLQTLSDAHGKETDRASGTLIIQRPGKFSWEIHPPVGNRQQQRVRPADGVRRHQPVVLRPRPGSR